MATNSWRLAAAIVILTACAKVGDKPAATTTDSVKEMAPAAPTHAKGVAVKVAAPAIAKLMDHPMPKTAKRATTIGEGKLAHSTAQAPKDDDALFVEQMDLAGDGVAEQASIVVDEETHTSYAATAEETTCKDGTVVKGKQLTAVYGAKNPFSHPAGSGWTATEVGAGSCGSAEPMVWGARFDANGNITSEGEATFDPKTGDLVIVTATSH
jgi:hypothetical protein